MLIKCNNCGADYSEYAGCCPKCKAINQNKHELEKNCFDPYYKDTYFSYLNSNKKKAAKPVKEIPEEIKKNMPDDDYLEIEAEMEAEKDKDGKN